jgi:hypothetical protein
MTFYSYEIVNRSTYTLTGTYFSQWVDPDLGYAQDAYLYGYYAETRKLLDDLQAWIGALVLEPMPVGDPTDADSLRIAGEHADLAALTGEIQTLLFRLASHLDLFGDPAAYAPLLSFEYSLLMYSETRDP